MNRRAAASAILAPKALAPALALVLLAFGLAEASIGGEEQPRAGAARLQTPQCPVLPKSDEFRRKVAGAEIHPRSRQIIARIDSQGGSSLHPDFGAPREYGIPFVVVKHGQPKVPVRFTAYGSQSDKGPHPIPPDAPVEGGNGSDGDRHVLVVRRPAQTGGDCKLYELYRAFYRGGPQRKWSADSAAVFDLGRELPQRPRGWTSADAAGLPIFPGLVRYGEIVRGRINHAIRVTFEQTRREYILPATHYASESCHPDDPPMGLRLRLRSNYDLTGFSRPARIIAEALQTYGMIVADNGSNWFISGATDDRWRDGPLGDLKQIGSGAFEVVRSPGESVEDCPG